MSRTYTHSFEQRILEKLGQVLADEAKAAGVDVFTAAVNFAYHVGIVGPARLNIVRAAEAAATRSALDAVIDVGGAS